MKDVSLIRLMQLCSSGLPIGNFTYSQGLEWAVECQWIRTEQDLRDWLRDLIHNNLALLEIPVLLRMLNACQVKDALALGRWTDLLLAHRETSELRLEENNRGRAMHKLLLELNIDMAKLWTPILIKSQSAGFALAAKHWKVPLSYTVQGFGWSWLENMVLSGIKLIPLGQMAGQRILRDLAEELYTATEKGLNIDDDSIGSSAPALAHASACHETQYTRLFRS